MKKILFIAPIDTKDRFKGGITSYAESIIKNENLFNSNGIHFVPLNNCLVNRDPGTNGKFSLLNLLNFFKTKRLIKNTLKKEKFDAIYLNTSYGISLLKDLLTLGKKYSRKYQVFLHIHFADANCIFTKNKLIRKMIIKNLKTKVTNIISLSTKFKAELVEKGFDENKVSVLYNYFDPNLKQIDHTFIEKKYTRKVKPLKFLFVGSLDKRKGFYDLIKTFNNLDPNDATLTICGKPNDKEASKILEQNKNNKIYNIKGYVNGEIKDSVFLESNVLILPSYGEGLPITILEAFNFGLPVISTSVGSIPEIISTNVGTLIPPGDLTKLENAIKKYFDYTLLKEQSLFSYQKSKEFTFTIFSKKLIDIMKKN